MTAKQKAWISAYCAGLQIFMPIGGISAEKAREGAKGLANNAAADFEAAFPEISEPKMEPDNDFIKIPRKDANGFELPEWVKPGAKCFHQGHIRIIDFVGVDEMGAWCCRLGWDGDDKKSQWAFVSNLKPYNG